MSDLYWILDKNHKVVKTTIHEWSRFMSNGQGRRVGYTKIKGKGVVSTIFTGLYVGPGTPMFETAWFGLTSSQIKAWRFVTWEEAKAGHAAIVYKVQNDLEVPK